VGVGHVAWQDQIGTEFLGDRRDAAMQRLALICEGQFRSLRMHSLGDAICDRAVVGDAHDEPALAFHQTSHCLLRIWSRWVWFWHRAGKRARWGMATIYVVETSRTPHPRPFFGSNRSTGAIGGCAIASKSLK